MAHHSLGYATFLQRMVREGLSELALTHKKLRHQDALDHLETIVPRQSAWYSLVKSDPRRILPPGCHMTATHFVFD